MYEGHTGHIGNVLTVLETGKQTINLPIKSEDEHYTFEGIIKNAVRFYEKNKCIGNFEVEDITVGNYEKGI